MTSESQPVEQEQARSLLALVLSSHLGGVERGGVERVGVERGGVERGGDDGTLRGGVDRGR